MVEITPEMASLLLDFSLKFVLMLGSGILGAYLTYVYAIRKTLQERMLTERVALYRPLVHSLFSLIDLSPEEASDPEKIKTLEAELERLRRDLLLYAPSEIYRAFLKAMSTVKKGATARGVVEFMLSLREELVGETDITLEEVMEIKLVPRPEGNVI